VVKKKIENAVYSVIIE